MYQRDYILRMIEMLGELIAGILGLIKKGDFKKASQSLENAYYDMLKQDASFFQNISNDNLTNSLLTEHNYTNGHLEILSELFFAQAELFYAQGNLKDSLVFYEKTQILFDFIMKESKTLSLEKETRKSSIKDRIEELKNSLK
jgi:hypothetical protein